MSSRILKYFAIWLLSVVSVCLMAVVMARAATTETSVYAISVTEGAGFDPGGGIAAEHIRRWEHLGVAIGGEIVNQSKHNAEIGWKYGAEAQGRIYYDRLYIGGGAAYAGYDSEFAGGLHWKKSSIWPVASVGLDTDNYDLWVAHYFEEGQTENRVSETKAGASFVAFGGAKVFSEVAHLRYTQAGHGMDDLIATVGVGWQF